MNGDELVKDVDAQLATLLDECQRSKENPRLIRLITQVMRLTDVEGERAAEATAQQTDAEAAPANPALVQKAVQAPAPEQPSTCPPHAPNVFGTCTKCGESGIKIAG